jgi:hypothetical protein
MRFAKDHFILRLKIFIGFKTQENFKNPLLDFWAEPNGQASSSI